MPHVEAVRRSIRRSVRENIPAILDHPAEDVEWELTRL
jgi:hypothetical protein